jgi:hypothetical protein
VIGDAIIEVLSLPNVKARRGSALKNVNVESHVEALVEPMGFESASCMETKEFCGATWPSKELKRKERNSYCPLIAPEN